MYSEKLIVEGKWWFPNSNIKFKGKLTLDSSEGGKLIIFGPVESFMILDTYNSQTQAAIQESNQSYGRTPKSKDDRSIILGESIDKKKILFFILLGQTKGQRLQTIIVIKRESLKLNSYFLLSTLRQLKKYNSQTYY
jgi:ApeA N-terminal domain 1